jgi:hypothetical protein
LSRTRFLSVRSAAAAALILATVTVAALWSAFSAGASSETGNFYCLNRNLSPGQYCNNGVYHNFIDNSIQLVTPDSLPTGLYFLTPKGLRLGVANGYGNISVRVSGNYYDTGYCWNRSAVYNIITINCVDGWLTP